MTKCYAWPEEHSRGKTGNRSGVSHLLLVIPVVNEALIRLPATSPSLTLLVGYDNVRQTTYINIRYVSVLYLDIQKHILCAKHLVMEMWLDWPHSIWTWCGIVSLHCSLPARLRKFAGRLSVAFLPWPGKHHVFGQVNKPHLTNLRSTTRSKCKGPQITCHYPDYIQIQIRCYCVTSWGQTVLRMGMSAQVLNVDVNIRPAYRVIACFLYNQSDVTRPNVTGDQQEWRRNVQCELV